MRRRLSTGPAELPHPDAATAAEARRKRRTSMMEISQRVQSSCSTAASGITVQPSNRIPSRSIRGRAFASHSPIRALDLPSGHTATLASASSDKAFVTATQTVTAASTNHQRKMSHHWSIFSSLYK